MKNRRKKRSEEGERQRRMSQRKDNKECLVNQTKAILDELFQY